MIENKTTKNIQDIFGTALEIEPLLRQLVLREVRLLESSSFLNAGIEEFKIPNIEQNIGTQINQNEKTPIIILQFQLELHGKSDTENELLRILARYGTIYILNSQEKFDHEIIAKFAQIVGLNIIWPYWREFVQSMTSRMGLPPLTLPLIRPGDLKFTKDQEENKTSEKETSTS